MECSGRATGASQMRQRGMLLLGLLSTALLLRPASADDGYVPWASGRATFYGDDGGATIHEGSCMYYQLDANKGTGWDIAALSDQNYDYSGSCGRCYEVGCDPVTVQDGYGQSLDRRNACKDPSRTVIVRITDSCPCHYPNNQYSNKRWCCGDQYHMDLSQWAFEKLADSSQGVIGIKYRPVACPGDLPVIPSKTNPNGPGYDQWEEQQFTSKFGG